MTTQQGGPAADCRGDDVYQPDGDDREVREDTGLLDSEDTLDDRGMADVLDEGYSPPERPLAVEDVGTTGSEQQSGESLDERLARERPDGRQFSGDGLGDASDTDGELLDPEAGELRSGRLVGPDEGIRSRRDGVSGEDVGIDGGAASAEEAAVHVVQDTDLPVDEDELAERAEAAARAAEDEAEEGADAEDAEDEAQEDTDAEAQESAEGAAGALDTEDGSG